MLFLLNDTIIEIGSPEAHLMQRWRHMGCGDPRQLRAQDAIEFARETISVIQKQSESLQTETAKDIAALIVAKTGANSLILKPTAGGSLEPRLRDVPAIVLETYQRGSDQRAPTPPRRLVANA